MTLLSSHQDESPPLSAGWSDWPPSAWLRGGSPRSDCFALPCASGPCQRIPATTLQTLGGDGKTTEIILQSLSNASSLFQSSFPDKHFFSCLSLYLKPTFTNAIEFVWLSSVCVCVIHTNNLWTCWSKVSTDVRAVKFYCFMKTN